MIKAPYGWARCHQRPRSIIPSAARTSISRTGLGDVAIAGLGTISHALLGTRAIPRATAGLVPDTPGTAPRTRTRGRLPSGHDLLVYPTAGRRRDQSHSPGRSDASGQPPPQAPRALRT